MNKLISINCLASTIAEFYGDLKRASHVFVAVEDSFDQWKYITPINPLNLVEYAIKNGGAIVATYGMGNSITMRINYCGTDYMTGRRAI